MTTQARTAPVVLVTGALAGIGRATALAFARQGARLVVSGRNADAGATLVHELAALGAESEFVQADVRHEADVQRVVVSVGGRVVADSRAALTLQEASYPPVQYIPRADVDMAQLQRSTHSTYCPYKGDCAYYSVPAGGDRAIDAVWTYESPYDAVASIRDHLAFYPARVDSIEQHA